MKLVSKILLTLSTLVCLVLIIGYFFIQSPFGVGMLNRYLAEYGLQVDKISHNFHKPYELVLTQLHYRNPQQGVTLNLAQAEVGFVGLFNLRKLDYLILKQGTIQLDKSCLSALPKLRLLQLIGVDIQIGEKFKAQGVNGGLLAKKQAFTFSANTVQLADIALQNGFIEGHYAEQQWFIDSVGADVASGYFVAKGRRYSDGHWLFENLKFNDIKSVSADFSQFWQRYASQLPDIAVRHLELTNIEIDSPQLKLSGFDVNLHNIAVKQGQLQLDGGRLVLNADHLIYPNVLALTKLNLQANLAQNQLNIKGFSAYWQQGVISASGLWDWHEKKLALDNLTLSGVDVVLPQSLPWHNQQLNELTIGLLTITPSIVVGLPVDFPFQFTNFTGSARDLQLIKQGQLGVWTGKGNLMADNATLNSIALRHFSVNFAGGENQLTLDDFSALTDNGVVDSQLALTQPLNEQNSRPIQQLQLSAKNISAMILDKWYLAEGLQQQELAQIELHLERGQGTVNLQTVNETQHYNVHNYHVIFENAH